MRRGILFTRSNTGYQQVYILFDKWLYEQRWYRALFGPSKAAWEGDAAIIDTGEKQSQGSCYGYLGWSDRLLIEKDMHRRGQHNSSDSPYVDCKGCVSQKSCSTLNNNSAAPMCLRHNAVIISLVVLVPTVEVGQHAETQGRSSD